MKLKYPAVYNPTQAQQELKRINNDSLEYPTIESQIVSILASLTLLATIFYMYITSRKKLKFHITKNSATYTFSEAVENSEKIGSVILIILFLAFLQSLFTIQNFNRNNFERASLVVVNYIVVLGILLLFYIGPSKYVGHGFIALVLTTTILYTSAMINILYHRFYTDDSLYELNTITYTIVAFFILLVLVFGVFAVTRFSGNYYIIVHHILSISELGFLFLYSIFIIYFGQMPKLMADSELSCIIGK
jgi:hypothetical protein